MNASRCPGPQSTQKGGTPQAMLRQKHVSMCLSNSSNKMTCAFAWTTDQWHRLLTTTTTTWQHFGGCAGPRSTINLREFLQFGCNCDHFDTGKLDHTLRSLKFSGIFKILQDEKRSFRFLKILRIRKILKIHEDFERFRRILGRSVRDSWSDLPLIKVFIQCFLLARTNWTTLHDIENVNLSLQGLHFSTNQHYPFYPQPAHFTPIAPTKIALGFTTLIHNSFAVSVTFHCKAIYAM